MLEKDMTRENKENKETNRRIKKVQNEPERTRPTNNMEEPDTEEERTIEQLEATE